MSLFFNHLRHALTYRLLQSMRSTWMLGDKWNTNPCLYNKLISLANKHYIVNMETFGFFQMLGMWDHEFGYCCIGFFFCELLTWFSMISATIHKLFHWITHGTFCQQLTHVLFLCVPREILQKWITCKGTLFQMSSDLFWWMEHPLLSGWLALAKYFC